MIYVCSQVDVFPGRLKKRILEVRDCHPKYTPFDIRLNDWNSCTEGARNVSMSRYDWPNLIRIHLLSA